MGDFTNFYELLSPQMGGVRGLKMGKYKNNNGNYSLGLVPIHRFQPRLLTMSDYCYSDWLRHLILDHFLQPMALGFCLLQQNLPAVLSSVLRRTSGKKCLSGTVVNSRRIWHQFQITRGRSPSFSEAL